MKEEERNQESSDSPVSIFEGVQNLKLSVNHSALNQSIDVIASDVLLKSVQMNRKLQRIGRNKLCHFIWCCPMRRSSSVQSETDLATYQNHEHDP